jgi:hypothetical protein
LILELSESRQSKQDWRAILRNFVAATTPADYRWTPHAPALNGAKADFIVTLNPTDFPHLLRISFDLSKASPQLPAGDNPAGPNESHGLASGGARSGRRFDIDSVSWADLIFN